MPLFSNHMMTWYLGFLILGSVMVGCTDHSLYRTEIVQPPEYAPEKPEHAEQVDIEKGTNGYLLGFAEFDDQGAFWARDQVLDKPDNLLTRLEEGIANEDMLLVVFVHGWKNNASYSNGNVKTFRKVLEQLQEDEIANTGFAEPRRVVGIYVGWRGLSLYGWVLNQLTFWDRKNTAEKVGHGAVTDLLRHIELLRSKRETDHPNDRLITVGHSFGGAIVHSALSQIITDRFIEAKLDTRDFSPRPFGDLVLLFNPAFEAQRYETLHEIDKSQHPRYHDQLPILAILTSETDQATKIAFPIGRWFSTFWEEYKDDDENTRNRSAIGHYDPYKTHRLFLTSPQEPVAQNDLPSIGEMRSMLDSVRQGWKARSSSTPCGWKQEFGQTTLEHLCQNFETPVNSPYLVIAVDEAVMDGHNDIANPTLIEFVREFVLSSLR